MDGLKEYLREHAQGDLLPWSAQAEAAERFGLSWARVELAALEAGYLPGRYQRNRNVLSVTDQLKLFRSRAAIVGCGGLGGYVIEQLARLGVGTLVAVDPDVFEEHNLNRQILSQAGNLGCAKAGTAATWVAAINPAVTVIAVQAAFGPGNGRQLLEGASVAVDALDSISSRRQLAAACNEMQIPLVHGAIAGWCGQVATQFPGEEIVQRLYENSSEDKGVERRLGNPAFTPGVIASMETAEVCKILLDTGQTLRGRIVFVDLLHMSFDTMTLGKQ
jgi:molybdopterin/thiamine biosynthesis adenylyltransferase